jgi:hypothetical protein
MNALRTGWALLAAAPLAIGTALAQHDGAGAPPETITLDAQGGGYPEWFKNPHIVEFYALSVALLRAPRGPADVAAYEQQSYAIFRLFAESIGADPDAMISHLQAIPGEMVGIVANDPAVLDSYDNFLVALRGPP